MRALISTSLILALSLASAARAEIYTINYFGTVGASVDDAGRIFSDGTTNLSGMPFAVSFTVNDGIGLTEIYSTPQGAFNQDVTGGLVTGFGNTVTASVNINGTTIYVGDYQVVGAWDIDIFNPPELGYIPSLGATRFGSIGNGIEYVPGNVDNINVGDLPAFKLYLQVDAYGSPASLFPDRLDQPFALLVDGTHYASNSGDSLEFPGSNGETSDLQFSVNCVVGSATASPASACPAASAATVPEPSLWAEMLFGFAALGVVIRRGNIRSRIRQ
jgi:hypothetical protein